MFVVGRCVDVGTVKNGARQGSDFSYGKSVSFTCNNGYALVGSNQRLCQQSGLWSAEQPRCVRKCEHVLFCFENVVTVVNNSVKFLLQKRTNEISN